VSFHCAPLISLFLYICKTIVALWRGTWRFIVARRDLAQLVELDDRMLADIGLRRSDLHAAQCAPFWEDPTRLLKRCVDCRRATFETPAQTPVSTISDTDPATHCAVTGVSQRSTALTVRPHTKIERSAKYLGIEV